MAELLGNRLFTAVDTNGRPISGAHLTFFLTGTTTPVTVYQNATLTTPHATPVVCDSAGRAPDIYYSGSVALKMVIADAGDVPIRTIDPFNTVGSAGNLAFTQAGAGAVARTVQDKLRERMSVKDFGAVCDRVTDDTAAVQACITACLAAGVSAMVVPGSCLITSSDMIDRLVDTTTSDFHILGEGPNAGFYCTTAITMFSTSLAYVATPVSERIIFHNIQFECASAATAAYVISQRMLRVTFENCRFYKIKCVASTNYLQSFHFRECYATRHTGFFFSATTFAYNILADVEMEGSGVEQGFHAASFIGCEVRGIYEGILGPIWDGPSSGLKYDVAYSEGNTNPDLVLTPGGALSAGVHIGGGIILESAGNLANPNFYPIVLGSASGVQVSGLSSSGNFFDDSQVPLGELVGTVKGYAGSTGNFTKSGRPIRAYPASTVPLHLGLVANAGSVIAGATQLYEGYNEVSTVGGAGYSLQLPSCVLDYTGSGSRVVVVRNNGANAAAVFVSYFDGSNYGVVCTIDGVDAYTAGATLWPGETRIFYSVPSYGVAGKWQSFNAVSSPLRGSAVYDPPNLADGAGVTTTVTVTGAALGDYATCSFSLDLQGITVTAWVSAANTVSVRFQNESGGALDLASGTLRARVTK